jgi:hypothetical protein
MDETDERTWRYSSRVFVKDRIYKLFFAINLQMDRV